MIDINRSLMVVKSKQPFLDWIQSLDEEDKDLTLGDLSKDLAVYLIPELLDDSERQAVLEWCYDIVFEAELAGWWTDSKLWLQKRDLKMFLEWFDVEFHSLVLDLCDDPIHAREYDLTDDSGNGTKH